MFENLKKKNPERESRVGLHEGKYSILMPLTLQNPAQLEVRERQA